MMKRELEREKHNVSRRNVGLLERSESGTHRGTRADTGRAVREVQYGKPMSKLDILYLYITHEMYHRGQITVYERLLQIEPAATAQVRELLAANE